MNFAHIFTFSHFILTLFSAKVHIRRKIFNFDTFKNLTPILSFAYALFHSVSIEMHFTSNVKFLHFFSPL